MTQSNDFMLSVKYTQKKEKKENQCNLTALHKEPLCRDISFLLLSGVSRVALEGPEGSRAGENNVGSREKRKRNMLSFLRSFFCDILFSFNRPFHVSTSSVRSDGLYRTFYSPCGFLSGGAPVRHHTVYDEPFPQWMSAEGRRLIAKSLWPHWNTLQINQLCRE